MRTSLFLDSSCLVSYLRWKTFGHTVPRMVSGSHADERDTTEACLLPACLFFASSSSSPCLCWKTFPRPFPQGSHVEICGVESTIVVPISGSLITASHAIIIVMPSPLLTFIGVFLKTRNVSSRGAKRHENLHSRAKLIRASPR